MGSVVRVTLSSGSCNTLMDCILSLHLIDSWRYLVKVVVMNDLTYFLCMNEVRRIHEVVTLHN